MPTFPIVSISSKEGSMRTYSVHIEADSGYYQAELEIYALLRQIGGFYFCSNSHPH